MISHGCSPWCARHRINRAARVRALLEGERVDADSAEAVLGYRLRQHHVGTVCWVGGEEAGGGALVRLEQATREVAAQAGCEGRPLFLPQDECSARAWLPLGARDTLIVPTVRTGAARKHSDIRFALGAAGAGVAGFRRTHRQALGAHAVALAAGPSGPRLTSFTEVAPLALMAGSTELLRAWVHETLGQLAMTMTSMPGCVTPCASSCRKTAASRPPPNGSSCTRTASSIGSARPRRPSGIPSTTTACTSN